MTKKARLLLLDRVRNARRRLRDAAAGELATAEAEEALADERRTDAETDVDEVKDAAMARLPDAKTVRVLWALEHEHVLALTLLREADEAARLARDESARQRAHLVARARELKTAEKAMDKTRAGLVHDERRAEQRSNDDLASRPRREE